MYRRSKRPPKAKHVWAILVRLELAKNHRDLALFNTSIDSKLRSGDLVQMKVADVMSSGQIKRHGWLAGPEMSLADISFGTQLFRYFTVPFDRSGLPALRAYYNRLCTRPAYAKHVMVSYESLRVPGA